MKHGQLNHEQLSLVTGGSHGAGTVANGGNGKGGGDGLGWLRNFIRAVDKAFAVLNANMLPMPSRSHGNDVK